MKKIAIWHRYGPADHVQCGGHCIPAVVTELSKHAEVHYFGMKTNNPVPEQIARHAVIHTLPFYFRRSSMRSKVIKTLLWYSAMPWMGLYCRIHKFNAIFIDETIPLTAPIVRFFFGPNLAMTIMDFFLDIYFEKARILKPLCSLLKKIDVTAWRKLPVIYTKVDYTREYLAELGVDKSCIHTVYNPCDTNIFFPSDKKAMRKHFGFTENDVVLVHHGILHPNKGNDRIISAVAELREKFPQLRFLLIGDGAEMQNLKALIAKLNLQDIVIMPGWLPTEADLNKALGSADIGLVMRIGQFTDNFHLTETLSHEMACGLPIIAANLKGIAEVIKDGENGYLFDPKEMTEFKNKLSKLIISPDQRNQFGKQSIKLCKEYCSLERATQLTLNPLLKLLENNVTVHR